MTDYEAGYRHGLARDRAPNPCPVATSSHEQYARGYADGAAQSGAPSGQCLLPSPESRMLWPFELDLLRRDLQEAVGRT